ncbi:retromer subunit VPS17 NDAI_0C01440 [Naumovozyma dairenensis CBS 421]|uniref:Vacuolar protein sorting-associated protein 17 n=1 Tax=Naumovozyma dairenensis (strain ATCC 10597 / BCRC 20456 / CBS 421 / NBRC 0211 / NRRL Y-12639) TaxID=1071378 RepID=G0W7P4_NAUDC|nr:hypothetical protein NDAI_0C01440 [Naumovozyma dairenensis CBS 421]CCD23805.1 hypothetical protein NDAI_0C01440 [Naumovozyma dairenensis CBS 421]
MTSTVPYDEFDSPDNNPFAEPPLEHTDTEQPHESNVASTPATTAEQEVVASTQVSPPSASTLAEETSTQPHDNQHENKETNILPERSDNKLHAIIKVLNVERKGALMEKKENPIIIFDITTNVPTFRKTSYKNIKKTYQEFTELFKYLNGSLPECFIPSLPLSYTNYGIQNKEDQVQLLKCFQNWFNRITMDPFVLRNNEFAFFIECDTGSYLPLNKNNISQTTGLKRKTLKQLAPPYDEVMELAEFRPMVKSIYLLVQGIQEKLLKCSKLRKLMVQEENAVGQGFVKLGDLNTSRGSKLYKRFGKILNAIGDVDSIIATMDMGTLYDGLSWIVRDSYVVKETLTDRHLVMRELSQAQQNSKVKQEQARRLRSKRDSNPLKVDDALRSLKQATRTEQELTLKLQKITANMLIEQKEWLEWYESWLITSIKEYTIRRIEYERKKLTLLERVRQDVRKADVKGGLSRLGREMTSSNGQDVSQSIEGDSWTGENRHRTSGEIDFLSHTEFDHTLGLDIQEEANDGSSDEEEKLKLRLIDLNC